MKDRFIHQQGLLALLVTQVAVIAQHAVRIPLWLWLLAILVWVWRYQIFRSRWSFPGRWLRLSLVIFSLAAIFLHYRNWYTLEPMVTLLILAFLMKSLELRQTRDATVLVYVGYFLTASAYLFDQSIPATLVSLPVVVLLTGCLFILQADAVLFLSKFTFKRVFVLLLQSVPVMLLLLFLFPRIGTLWSVPIKSDSAVTGISDSMSPGDFSQLTRSGQLAFRVNFADDQLPPPSERYWRGLALSDFDGRRWSRQSEPSPSEHKYNQAAPKFSASNSSNVYDYQVVLEATNRPWLYAMPLASVDGGQTRRTVANEIFRQEPVIQRTQYRVTSTPLYRVWETAENLRRARLLPHHFNPQTLMQAKLWRQQVVSDSDYIDRVLRFYNERFFYTLSPPVLGQNSVDEFLFLTQRGFCEHFASSFVVLMRAVGIPARVVTGYQGGEWNAEDRYLIVRQYDAHAWAEVWLPNQGWVRVDPTAAVAPSRIEQGIFDSLVEEDKSLIDGRVQRSFAWVNRLMLQWDSLNYQWQRWVLSYDNTIQSQLLKQLLGQVTPMRVALLLLGLGSLMLFISACFTLVDIRSHKLVPKTVRLHKSFCRRLRKRGVEIEPGDTLAQICEKAQKALPKKHKEIDLIVRAMNQLLYQPVKVPDDQLIRRLKNQIQSV